MNSSGIQIKTCIPGLTQGIIKNQFTGTRFRLHSKAKARGLIDCGTPAYVGVHTLIVKGTEI